MTKEILFKLQEMGKEFNVLYVEDEKESRENIAMILKQIFCSVYVAENGAEGLDIFKTIPIDMVFTDVEMPIMNGLDMTQKIKEISSDIPICIISAYNDTDKFTKAIIYGVNRYLLKPIKQESIVKTIYEMILDLTNKLDAKKYHIKLQNEKILKAVEKTAQYFLKSIPSPVFVVDSNQKIIYLNELLNKMLIEKNINVEIGDNIETIESIFSLDNGKKISINAVENESVHAQKIIFKNNHKKLFFTLRKQEVEIPTIDGLGTIIILNDVTIQMEQIRMIEYQKQKNQANKEILEEFLNRNVFTVSQENKEKTKKLLEKSAFIENADLLRRTHIYKISAKNYITTQSDTIEDDLDELNELELDLQSELYEFEFSQKYETLMTIADIFQLYANELIRLIEFSDLADSIEATSMYLKELTQESIETNGYMIKAVIQSVLDDLSNWKEHVFITQTTDDIHYLDSSLYNTILELKNSFEQNNSTNKTVNEDELEFF